MQSCESCGRAGEELTTVQRVYLMPDDTEHPPTDLEAEAEDARAVAGDIEMWCASCRATYPHIEVSAG